MDHFVIIKWWLVVKAIRTFFILPPNKIPL